MAQHTHNGGDQWVVPPGFVECPFDAVHALPPDAMMQHVVKVHSTDALCLSPHSLRRTAQHAPGGATVASSARVVEEHPLRLHVWDHGPMMAESQVRSYFSRFGEVQRVFHHPAKHCHFVEMNTPEAATTALEAEPPGARRTFENACFSVRRAHLRPPGGSSQRGAESIPEGSDGGGTYAQQPQRTEATSALPSSTPQYQSAPMQQTRVSASHPATVHEVPTPMTQPHHHQHHHQHHQAYPQQPHHQHPLERQAEQQHPHGPPQHPTPTVVNVGGPPLHQNGGSSPSLSVVVGAQGPAPGAVAPVHARPQDAGMQAPRAQPRPSTAGGAPPTAAAAPQPSRTQQRVSLEDLPASKRGASNAAVSAFVMLHNIPCSVDERHLVRALREASGNGVVPLVLTLIRAPAASKVRSAWAECGSRAEARQIVEAINSKERQVELAGERLVAQFA